MDTKAINTPLVVLSAERPEYTPDENRARTLRLIGELEGRDYAPTLALGIWEGRTEVSLVLGLDADRYVQWHIGELSAIAQRYDQDAILYVQWNGTATLISSADSSTDVDVGVWRKVDRATAFASVGYTLLGGEYYVAQ
jgi:hypothetical protein